ATRLTIRPLLAPFYVPRRPPRTGPHYSVHDALPISQLNWRPPRTKCGPSCVIGVARRSMMKTMALLWKRKTYFLICIPAPLRTRSEEHTSELQSRQNVLCRLLHEKKKMTTEPARG